MSKSKNGSSGARSSRGGSGTALTSLRSIRVEEFVQRLADQENRDRRFALFLGAGCSVTSGIPTAGDLVKNHWLPRLARIQAPERRDVEQWAHEEFQYDAKDPAGSYGTLIDRLFLTPEERRAEIERLCEGQTPSYGYAVLAQLIARYGGSFNVVLTTNFDDMVSDALYLYTDARPLVIQHESLAAFIRPTRMRPLVVKLHGDHRLAPRNTVLETQRLERETRKHTALVLQDRGLIFMGYGGNDRGIYDLLRGLAPEALPYGVFWVHPQEPSGPIRDWLVSRDAYWVKSGWFDEVMLLVQDQLELPHPGPERFLKIFENYKKNWQELSSRIAKRRRSDVHTQTLKAAAASTGAELSEQKGKVVRLEKAIRSLVTSDIQ